MRRLLIAAVLACGCSPACPEAVKAASDVPVEACAYAYDQVRTEEDFRRLELFCPAAAEQAKVMHEGGAETLCKLVEGQ